jgi:hypothetical protein
MLPLNSDSWLDLSLLSDDSLSVAPRQADEDVFRLFDRHAAPLLEEIAPAVRQAVLRDYGMDGLSESDYELDYLITPELGGSSDRRNLWPERYGARMWNARVKDQLELLLPSLVCRGAVDLSTAPRDIAVDWIAAYKKYVHADRPVIAQARVSREE